MKTETILILAGVGAVAYFGGFIPNTKPYLAKQNKASGGTTAQSTTGASQTSTIVSDAEKAYNDIASFFA